MSAALKTGGDAKAMRTTKFPEEFNVKIDMRKIEHAVIMRWIKTEISKILDSDDDVVPGMIEEALKPNFPNFKKLQIDLSGFLDKDAPSFCLQLVKLCISAQNSPTKVPPELVEAKKKELLQGLRSEDEANALASKRQPPERNIDHRPADNRDRDRDRERRDRGRGQGGPGRFSDRRPPPRDTMRSPPRRRDSGDFDRAHPPRFTDSYVPSGRRGRGHDMSRSRSPRPRKGRGTSPAGRRFDDEHRGGSRRYRSRSPPRRRRSKSRSDDDRYPPSGRRQRRGYSPRSRSPPRRYGRHRRNTSSPSTSPPPRRRRRPESPRRSPRDLLSKPDRKKDAHRLERPVSSQSASSQSEMSDERHSADDGAASFTAEKRTKASSQST